MAVLPGTPGLHRARTLLLALAAVLLLAGCYPELDWKEMRSAEGGFKVLMPARWEIATVNGADGITRVRVMAQTPNALFGVGYADYPDEAASHIAATRDGLLPNARGRLTEDRVINGPTGTQARAVGIAGIAADGSPREIHARLIAREKRLFQLAVVSKPGTLSSADLDTFFLSFELVN